MMIPMKTIYIRICETKALVYSHMCQAMWVAPNLSCCVNPMSETIYKILLMELMNCVT